MYPIIDFLTGKETLMTTTQYMTEQRKAGKKERCRSMVNNIFAKQPQPLPVVDFLGD